MIDVTVEVGVSDSVQAVCRMERRGLVGVFVVVDV